MARSQALHVTNLLYSALRAEAQQGGTPILNLLAFHTNALASSQRDVSRNASSPPAPPISAQAACDTPSHTHRHLNHQTQPAAFSACLSAPCAGSSQQDQHPQLSHASRSTAQYAPTCWARLFSPPSQPTQCRQHRTWHGHHHHHHHHHSPPAACLSGQLPDVHCQHKSEHTPSQPTSVTNLGTHLASPSPSGANQHWPAALPLIRKQQAHTPQGSIIPPTAISHPHPSHVRALTTTAASSPATQGSRFMAALPAAWVPYAQLMRLDKPIGTWLLLWPCLWSIALAAPPGHLPDPYTMGLFSLGAVLLRGAGCTINDLWDRDLDGKVERTRTRPLASGALQPWQAVALLSGQLSLGLCVLLQLNTYSQLLGASSLLLVGTYPLMKRVTYWPQAFLGLTINWGALLGWAAVRGSCDWSVVLPLYLSGVCWSLVYDTIYAHQDKKDDVQAGVKSTALLFGDRTKEVLSGFAVAQCGLLYTAGVAADVGPLYHAGVAALALHLAWQIVRVDLNNGPLCSATFVSNKWAGALVFLGCLAGRYWP